MKPNATRVQLRDELRTLCKAPPQDFGVMRTRAWLDEVRRAKRYLKRMPREETARKLIAVISGVSALTFRGADD